MTKRLVPLPRSRRRSMLVAVLGGIVFGFTCHAQLSTNAKTPPATASHKPDTEADVVGQISSALRAQKYDAALNLCSTALRRTPSDPRIWTLQALAQSALNQKVPAITSYRRAVSIAPNYLPAWQGLAQLNYAVHDPAAKQTLEHVVALSPRDSVAHAMLGALAFANDDCATVVDEFSKAGALLESRPDTSLQWGSCLLQLGRTQEAATRLNDALGRTPASATLRYDTALAEWKSGDKAAAQQTLEPLLTDPTFASDALTLSAEIAEEQNDTQRALDLLRKAMLANPQNRDSYLDFARLAYDHASVQVGIDIVNIGLQNLPNDAQLFFARGVLLAQNGKMDQSMADLDRASQLDPHLSFVGTAQGIAASQAHQFATAEDKLREQTRRHPTDAAAWYLLAEALADQSVPPESAKHREMVHAAEEAVHLDPHSADAHSQLASIYLRDNDAGRAIAECNAALAVNPDDPQTLYQLLLATRKTGQKDQLPSLVKRLVAAREAAEAQDKNNHKQTLTELPAVQAPGGSQ